MLTDVLALAVTGRIPYPVRATDDQDELHKRIATAYKTGHDFLRLDNLAGRLNDPTIAECLTTARPQFRLLGRNESIEADGRFTSWMATGRTVEMTTELLGRSHFIRLDARSAEPGERTGPTTGPRKGKPWQFPDILSAAADKRPELLAGLAAMISEWHKAGRPRPPADCPIIGGFEPWVRIVGGILHYCGIGGFLTQRKDFIGQRDETRSESAAFIQAWWEENQSNPVMAKELAMASRLETDEPLVFLEKRSVRGLAGYIKTECVGRIFPLEDGREVRCIDTGKKSREGGVALYRLAVESEGAEVVAALEKR